ncbi:MAG: flagellar basal body-associated FliL family protein [Solirubrobacteraceae bacterium]|nr:flagellar basal body-associated FliL family protein [Solirubrobacteraceae bacterium]
MKPKLILPVVLLLAGLFVGKTMFAKPAETKPKPKVHGEVYVMPKDFLINLKDGRFAKLNVGLVLEHGYLAEAVAEASGGGHEGGAKAPDGYGTLPQEALVRDIITDELTGAEASELISKPKRAELKEHIVKDIKSHTDVKIEEVILTDVAVQ